MIPMVLAESEGLCKQWVESKRVGLPKREAIVTFTGDEPAIEEGLPFLPPKTYKITFEIHLSPALRRVLF